MRCVHASASATSPRARTAWPRVRCTKLWLPGNTSSRYPYPTRRRPPPSRAVVDDVTGSGRFEVRGRRGRGGMPLQSAWALAAAPLVRTPLWALAAAPPHALATAAERSSVAGGANSNRGGRNLTPIHVAVLIRA
jgi:hypothetical protein